jgi:flagellar basal-body rod modification protein FlgD
MDALVNAAANATAAATRPGLNPGDADASDSSRGVIGSDFETFLKMLTAQIQNQDPLNPMDSSDYATQLATFSSVEQQVLTNELLRGMGGGMADLATYAGWVGMEARQDGPVVFDGTPMTLGLNLPDAATRTELAITTSDGIQLSRTDITGQSGDLIWAGQTEAGSPLLAGTYAIETISTLADGTVTRQPVSSYAAVTEVRTAGTGVELRLANGTVLAAESVTALRSPLMP